MNVAPKYRLVLTVLLTAGLAAAGCGEADNGENQNDNQVDLGEPDCSTAEVVDYDITDDTTWDEPGDHCYELVGEVHIQAHLTIEPGVAVRADQDAGLYVGSDGILTAEGTDEEPVLFSGTDESEGWWDGILFSGSTHPDNALDHVTVEYAGSDSMSTAVSAGTQAAGLTLGQRPGGPEVPVTNSTFRHNGGHGLFVHSTAELTDFENNTFTANESALSIHAVHIDDIGSETVAEDNDENGAIVRGGDIGEDTTWQALDFPWGIADGIEIVDDPAVTIEAGADIQFAEDTWLRIRDNTEFSIEGTDDDPVVMTGTTESEGWWDGIFLDSDHPGNSIDHAVIEYAGGDTVATATSHGTAEANLVVGQRASSATLAITNSEFRNSEGLGLFAHSEADLEDFATNHFEDNEEGPLAIHPVHIDAIDEDSTYEGHDPDVVHVSGGEIDDDTTWNNPGVPWRVHGDVEVIEVEVEILAGNEIQFAFDSDGHRFELDDNGILQVRGEDGDEVVFTSDQESPGSWGGLLNGGSAHPDNAIEHAIFEYAGSRNIGTATSSGTEPANLVIGQRAGAGQMTVTDSTFRNSDGYGIFIHEEADTNADICSANDFADNAEGDCLDESS